MRLDTLLLWLIIVATPLTSLAQVSDYLKRILVADKIETVLGQDVSVRPQLLPLDYAVLPSGEQYLMGNYWYTSSTGLESYFFISKLDAAGDLIWAKSREIEYPAGSSSFSKLIPRQDGGVWLIAPETHVASNLIHVDASGEIITQKQWRQAFDFQPQEAILGPNDGIYILRLASENHAAIGHNLLKLDANGNKVGELLIAPTVSTSHYSLNRMLLTADGGLVIAGQREGYENGQFRSSPTLLKFDASDNLSWSYELDEQRPFFTRGLMQNGNGAYLILDGFFDQVFVSIDENGTPEQVFVQETNELEFSTHERGANVAVGSTYLSISPISFFEDPNADGQWAVNSWDDQGTLNWSYYQALFTNNQEWITPIGIGKATSGRIGFAGRGYTVYDDTGEHAETILLGQFNPVTADNSSCVGNNIAWTSTAGTIQTQPSSWTLLTPGSPAAINPNFVFASDSLYTVSLCENTGGSAALIPSIPVRIGPNPVIDRAEVAVETPLGEVEMRITDPSGRVFLQEMHTIETKGNMSLDMSKMEAGVYLITITGPNFIWREKLIKAE